MTIGPGTLLLDRFLVGQAPLADGGMGKIWPGCDLRFNDREVAIKVMLNPSQADEGPLRRFRHEAQAAAKLQHPLFTTIYDFGELQGELFIVMELLKGRDLKALIKDNFRGMPVPQALNFACQAAEALAFAHANGVVHHDLKPANLFVLPNNRLKVCDLGIAKVVGFSALTGPEQAPGTPGYMAPEQLTGIRGDQRSDLYSLGCILYEMLTGHPPFPLNQDYHAQAYQHLHIPPPPLCGREEIPQELRQLVTRLLAKDAADRHQTAEDVIPELEKIKLQLR